MKIKVTANVGRLGRSGVEPSMSSRAPTPTPEPGSPTTTTGGRSQSPSPAVPLESPDLTLSLYPKSPAAETPEMSSCTDLVHVPQSYTILTSPASPRHLPIVSPADHHRSFQPKIPPPSSPKRYGVLYFIFGIVDSMVIEL
jgi:hypothetical protein